MSLNYFFFFAKFSLQITDSTSFLKSVIIVLYVLTNKHNIYYKCVICNIVACLQSIYKLIQIHTTYDVRSFTGIVTIGVSFLNSLYMYVLLGKIKAVIQKIRSKYV